MVFSWRLRSPGALMAAAVAVCAIFVVGTTWVAVDQPWLGLRLAPDEGGARIVAVNRAGVSDHLRAGERLIAVGGLPVVAEDLIEEPDNFETYAALDAPSAWRKAPWRSKKASRTRRSVVSAPVCDAAARLPRWLRPPTSATTGTPRSRDAAPSRTSDSGSPTLSR